MIRELSDLGTRICAQKYKEWNHVALKEEAVAIEIVIDDNGNFCRFETFEKKATIAEALTSKKGKARLLLDKAEEVLCYGDNSSKKHQWFLDKLNQYGELPDLKPVIAFYKGNRKNGLDRAMQEFVKQIPKYPMRKTEGAI